MRFLAAVLIAILTLSKGEKFRIGNIAAIDSYIRASAANASVAAAYIILQSHGLEDDVLVNVNCICANAVEVLQMTKKKGNN